MASLNNSSLLEKIYDYARKLAKENSCSDVTRDLLVVAAKHIAKSENSQGISQAQQQELSKLRSLLEENDYPADALIGAWAGKKVSTTEKMIMTIQKNKAQQNAASLNMNQVTADILLGIILSDRTAAMEAYAAANAPEPAEKKPAAPEPAVRPEKSAPPQASASEKPAAQAESENEVTNLSQLTQKTKALQQQLQQRVLGQAHAVSTFAAGYFQGELDALINKERSRPRATFLFAGPPGVGKTFLSEETARILGLPFRRFDMSEYAGPNAADELSGSDANYKASSEGLLTGFVHENPRCVLLFDEIEKASLEVIHLFLQVLDAGRLRDNRTDEEVAFKDAILIFTTNAGKSLYQDSASLNLSSVSRDVILDALARDVNPRTHEPFFPAAICSRFAAGNVVMFNHLEAHTLCDIVDKQLTKHFDDLKEGMKISIDFDRRLATTLLLSEGASADARTVKSRADAFFGGELYELFRVATSARHQSKPNELEKIEISLDLEHCPEEVRKLFVPQKRIQAMVYSEVPLNVDADCNDLPAFHYASNTEEAQKIIRSEDIQLILCDPSPDQSVEDFLNREDVDSPARSFLHTMLTQYPELPVVLLEEEGSVLTAEERESYFRRGVRGFVMNDGNSAHMHSFLKQTAGEIFLQNSLAELARANKLVTYETAQLLHDNGKKAEIVLFDLKMKTAIRSEDSENVMSMLSKPDVRFDDIIGSDDAKSELKYMSAYLKDPKQFAGKGVSAPKGILLYGPPGTGKTMLAKAFAAECNAAFIATEGNKFFKKYVGEGPEMVHRLFAAARRYAPAVLFVDEIDTFAKKRSGGDTATAQVTEEILTAFFSEMDGFSNDKSKPVIVLGATNYGVDSDSSMSLDPAMLRRFDRRILIDVPTLENRKLFLSKKVAENPLFDVSESMIESLAERSTGMSLALLSSMLELAMRSSLRNGGKTIGDAELEEAFETFNSGEKRAWSSEVMLRTARHEAGHTVISWLAGEKPSYVTIVSRGNHGGYMQHADQEDRMLYTRSELLDRIRTSLGGRAAEIVCYGSEGGISTGASSDLRSATGCARAMLCSYGMDEEFGLAVVSQAGSETEGAVRAAVNRILREQLQEAIRLITENRSRFDRLVDQLLQFNSLKGEDIDKCLLM